MLKSSGQSSSTSTNGLPSQSRSFYSPIPPPLQIAAASGLCGLFGRCHSAQLLTTPPSILCYHVSNGQQLLSRGRRPSLCRRCRGRATQSTILLEHEADVNAEADYQSVLARAARNGQSGMVRFLLHKGVAIMAPGNENCAHETAAKRVH